MKKSRFSANISFYLGDDTRYDYSYNGILMEYIHTLLKGVNSNTLSA